MKLDSSNFIFRNKRKLSTKSDDSQDTEFGANQMTGAGLFKPKPHLAENDEVDHLDFVHTYPEQRIRVPDIQTESAPGPSIVTLNTIEENPKQAGIVEPNPALSEQDIPKPPKNDDWYVLGPSF